MSAKITPRGGILAKHSVIARRNPKPRIIEILVRQKGGLYLAHHGSGENRTSASSTNSAFYAALSVAEKIFGTGKAKLFGKNHQWGKSFRAVESSKGGAS